MKEMETSSISSLRIESKLIEGHKRYIINFNYSIKYYSGTIIDINNNGSRIILYSYDQPFTKKSRDISQKIDTYSGRNVTKIKKYLLKDLINDVLYN